MREKRNIYKRYSHRLIQLFLFFLIGLSCFVLFLFTQRTKVPALSMTIFENLRDVSLDSVLFSALEESFLDKEKIKLISVYEDEEFLYGEFLFKPSPLLDSYTGRPLEFYFQLKNEEISFDRKNIHLEILSEKEKILYLDAKDMYISNDLLYFERLKEGMLIFSPGSIYRTFEVSSGFKEFKIKAKGFIVIPESKKLKDFDYSAEMQVFLDGIDLGKAYADIEEFKSFTFNAYLPEGWHTLAVAFTNDIWEPEKGLDRNLLVKDIEIYDIFTKGKIKIRKGFEEKYSFENLRVSYFSFLKEEYKNDLIRFFKSKFKIERLKDLIIKGYSLDTLIKDIDIAGLTKRAIFAPAPTKFKVNLKVPLDGIKITFSYGIMPEAWNKPGDGVGFVVKIETDKKQSEEVLFSKYINPKVNPEDRKWHQGEVDLRKFKGKEIALIFETRGSPVSPIRPFEDYLYDYAVWSE